jgi:NAD(P)-dependent dehydrogenase (short-subunit alcohol dehydrogenase family)
VTSPTNFDLTGSTALITGGAGLLGAEHAQALAEIGARVVVADLNFAAASALAANLEREFGSARAVPLLLDVSNPASVGAARDYFDAEGGVDVLINNAAIDPKVTPQAGLGEGSRVENFPLDQWNRELAVGLTGAFLCSQAFGAAMARRGRGVILNIASDLSVIAPDQRLYRKADTPDDEQPVKPVTYSVIKTGLIGMTRYFAAYWAAAGVRVNALSPGGVANGQPEDFVTRLTGLIPLGRMARHDEYRGAVQFLCSDASAYMTGQNIVIDGGRSVL